MKFVRRDPRCGYVDTWLHVPKTFINVDATKSALTFIQRDKRRDEDRAIFLYREAEHHLLLPRAFWDIGSLPFDVVDCRPDSYEHFEFKSSIQLDHRVKDMGGKKVLMPTGDDVQRRSIAALQAAQGGTLQLSCGKGKTPCALEKIAQDKVPALIILDNRNLLRQWEEDIAEFLEVPGGVGFIADGKFDWQKGVVLATYQSLVSKDDKISEEIARWFGNIVWDEGHHVSAETFSRTCTMFYGKRYTLTATPEREDGRHVISQFHIGPVLYKDLRQMMKAQFVFKWTGISLDTTDPKVMREVIDTTGEIHNSKVTSYMAGHRPNLQGLVQDAIDAVTAGRKILLLTDTVAEAVNLLAIWTRGWNTPLYTDIPAPTAEELGLEVEPAFPSVKELEKLKKKIASFWAALSSSRKVVGTALETEANKAMAEYTQYLAGKKVLAEHARRERRFLADLLKEPSGAGIMTFGVEAELQQAFLRDKQIIFGITKYGKEALDCPALDTILVSSLFSSRPGLQQLMGRPTRPSPGKKTPTVIFYVHNIGQDIGMAKKLQKHLRDWPVDESGPFEYDLLHYPGVTSCKIRSLKERLGS